MQTLEAGTQFHFSHLVPQFLSFFLSVCQFFSLSLPFFSLLLILSFCIRRSRSGCLQTSAHITFERKDGYTRFKAARSSVWRSFRPSSVPACHRCARLPEVDTHCLIALSGKITMHVARNLKPRLPFHPGFSSSRVDASTASQAAQGAQYLRLMIELSNSKKKNTLKSFNAEVKHAICSSITSSLSLLPSSRKPLFEPVACLDDALEVRNKRCIPPTATTTPRAGKIDQCMTAPKTINLLAGRMGGCCPMGGKRQTPDGVYTPLDRHRAIELPRYHAAASVCITLKHNGHNQAAQHALDSDSCIS